MPSPQIVEEAAKGSQLVGFRVNSGLSAETRTSEPPTGGPQDAGDRIGGRAVKFADVGQLDQAQGLAHDHGARVEGACERGTIATRRWVAVVGAGEEELPDA